MKEGTAYGPEASGRSDMAELARLADELISEIGAARRHYDDLRMVLDGRVPGDQALDEAHLVALSLALTGGDREDARRHLCDAFGIGPGDADEILDQAFGVQFDGMGSGRGI